jgi:glycosyltransferase involved in cell wall biosynthesis
MRVVIDARWIGPAPSGVGVYTAELLRRLPPLAPGWQWHLLFADEERRRCLLGEQAPGWGANVTSEVLPCGIFSPESQWRLPRRLRALRAGLYHSTNYLLPYLAFAPGGAGGRGCGRAAVTIHDVIPLLIADHAPRARKSRLRPLFRACLRQSVRRAAAVLTVSNTARSDIIRALRLEEAEAARIHVVYNGVSEIFRPRPADAGRGGVQTLLYVGRLDPYKNVVTLVRAFALLRRRHPVPLHLLIVGPDDPRYPEARRIAADLGLGDCVTFLGFLAPQDLVAVYQESSLLVNPSSYEGFGLPLLEAMRCGVPVVCCSGGAQPEIAGDAALIVPPGDAQALADAMAKVLTDEALRERLVAAGLRRAQSFTWERTARETLAVYRRALEGHSGQEACGAPPAQDAP